MMLCDVSFNDESVSGVTVYLGLDPGEGPDISEIDPPDEPLAPEDALVAAQEEVGEFEPSLPEGVPLPDPARARHAVGEFRQRVIEELAQNWTMTPEED